MNVEIGAEAAQFPEKEYIKGIAVAVQFEAPRNHRACETSVGSRQSHWVKTGKSATIHQSIYYIAPS
jgi:hypothetical protein